MYTILTVFQVLLAAAMVAVILVQRGAGATMGAAFGSGASGTVFGSRGAGGFLSTLTIWLGVAFFALSLGMAVLVARSGDVRSTPDDLGVAGQLVAPPADSSADRPAQTADPAGDQAEQFLDVPVDEEAADQVSAGGQAADEDDFVDVPPLD